MRVFATKHDDVRLVPRTHMLGRTNTCHPLTSILTPGPVCLSAHAQRHTYKINNNLSTSLGISEIIIEFYLDCYNKTLNKSDVERIYHNIVKLAVQPGTETCIHTCNLSTKETESG